MLLRTVCGRRDGPFLVTAVLPRNGLRALRTSSSTIHSGGSPHCTTSRMRFARRCCSTLKRSPAPNEDDTLPLLKNSLSEGPVQSRTPRSDSGTASLAISIELLLQHRAHMTRVYMALLADRRAQYRDQLLLTSVSSIQEDMQVLLRRLLASEPEGAPSANEQPQESPEPMTCDAVRRLKKAWTRINGVADHSRDAAMRHAYLRELRRCYSTLICCGLLRSESEVRLILSELHNTDLIEPDASFYEALFMALWSLSEVRGGGSATGEHRDGTTPQAPEIVAGEVRQLRRSVVGDLAGYYMGHALAQHLDCSRATENALPTHTAVRRETWEVFFATLANCQPAPKLLDLWWQRFLEWLDERTTTIPAKIGIDKVEKTTSSHKKASVPYQAAHAVLSWCAQSREMEKALNFFNGVNQRGVTVHADTMPNTSLPSELVEHLARPGCLTSPSTHIAVQELQLALFVKLMASTKSLQMVGGLRALVVRDVQQQITPAVLYAAPWGVINDFIAGLSVPSAMELLRRCSSSAVAVDAAPPTATKSGPSDRESGSESTMDSDPQSTRRREIPFYVWASLLRRCSREHLQDEAESLFVFLRKKFPITAQEKRELIEIMMRMYATLLPADFPSTMDVFLQHVLRTPEGEPKVQPDSVLYGLLVKAADSRNAAMMVFLEACAAGVSLTEEVFEALMRSTQYKTIASLSRKLPHDYSASTLDAQLKIPADADAHLRREEALRARGKPLYDSTGDAG
ncbi:hypothetical protein JKF63_01756 [Porcisia hertigi]|uniref:Uncharacterized protein n=1 Tax=Porcisia hertigi TaxID=2761500 RepID=A0A836L0P0_9TRYP|nr:hypothetical protein JKF63_01756 [Porcisia hertigi]